MISLSHDQICPQKKPNEPKFLKNELKPQATENSEFTDKSESMDNSKSTDLTVNPFIAMANFVLNDVLGEKGINFIINKITNNTGMIITDHYIFDQDSFSQTFLNHYYHQKNCQTLFSI